jgi:hypothetical protein
MPTATTQNDVITDLVDELMVLTALTGVIVTSAALDLALNSDDQACVIDIPTGDERWYGLGNNARDETYDIAMGCLAFRPGADEDAIRAARDRVYEIHNAIAGYIRDNPRRGGGVTIAQLSGVQLTQGFLDNQRYAKLEWSVRVQARIEVV